MVNNVIKCYVNRLTDRSDMIGGGSTKFIALFGDSMDLAIFWVITDPKKLN